MAPPALGRYHVIYQAADSSGKSAQAGRVVDVVDTLPPTLTLVGPSTVTLTRGAPFVDPGALAIDSFEGDLSSLVVVGGDAVGVGTPGNYQVCYDVSESSGNAAPGVTRTVTVVPPPPADSGGGGGGCFLEALRWVDPR